MMAAWRQWLLLSCGREKVQKLFRPPHLSLIPFMLFRSTKKGEIFFFQFIEIHGLLGTFEPFLKNHRNVTIFFLKIKVSNLSNFPLISITSLKQSKLNDDLNLSSSAANWPTLCITLCAAMNPIIGLFRSLTPSISARQKVKATASRVNFAWYSLVCLCSMLAPWQSTRSTFRPGFHFPAARWLHWTYLCWTRRRNPCRGETRPLKPKRRRWAATLATPGSAASTRCCKLTKRWPCTSPSDLSASPETDQWTT